MKGRLSSKQLGKRSVPRNNLVTPRTNLKTGAEHLVGTEAHLTIVSRTMQDVKRLCAAGTIYTVAADRHKERHRRKESYAH